ncbi:hypothetical protein BH23ACT9_BH23ACT9_28960 [soil metagenome]
MIGDVLSEKDKTALRVVIDARVRPGEQGGVQQTIIGLAGGLAQLEGPERYFFLVDGDGGWLEPYVAGGCELVRASFPGPKAGRAIKTAGQLHPGADLALRYLLETRGRVLPKPDRAVRTLRPHVIHFMRHRGWRTPLPNVYVPHDVQHVDLPHLFSARTRAYRQLVYGAMASQSTKLAALTSGQVPRLVEVYGVAAEDIVVVPWASVLSLYPSSESLPEALPERFVLYPAHSWPHKNHVALVHALALLRRRGTDVPVVLTGGRDAHWEEVAQCIREVGVDDLVLHLGFVDDAAMRNLYGAADALVFPSTYEGFGLPVVEALEAGTPVICADLPPLRDLAGAAGRFFDPFEPASIAASIEAVWNDAAALEEMRRLGRARLSDLSWTTSAQRYRALYRQIAGCATSADLALLARPAAV